MVGALWRQETAGEPAPGPAPLGEAELNTIGYVISRYGALTGPDLDNLTRSETPWRLADRDRSPRGSAPIQLEWLKDYFQTSGAPGEDDEVPLDTAEVRELLAEFLSHPPGSGKVDTNEELEAMLRRDA